MRKIRKVLSVILCISICLITVFSTLDMSGVSFARASVYDELWFIDGVPYALINNSRVSLGEGHEPYLNDTGTMYMPLSAVCSYTDSSYEYDSESGNVTVNTSDGSSILLTVGSAAWTKDGSAMDDFLIEVREKSGEPFITILMASDIFGLYRYLDRDLGALVLSKNEISGYNSSYSTVVNTVFPILLNAILEKPSGSTVYDDMVNYNGADAHPRLIIDSDRFREIRIAYCEESGSALYEGAKEQVELAESFFEENFCVSDDGTVLWLSDDVRANFRQPYYLYDIDGNRLVGQTEYTYTDPELGEITVTLEEQYPGSSGYGDGYDVGGRSSVVSFTEHLQRLAFAWQMTGEQRYADAFYLFALELDGWEHWGEGHFLNVADGAYAYAVGFDWIYHAFDNDTEKRDKLAEILYNKAMMKGYYSIKAESSWWMYGSNLHKSTVASSGWHTLNRTNNWQAVCGNGMIVSALMLMEYDEYRDNAEFVVESYMGSIGKMLHLYLPDGSYSESPGYWNYATSSIITTLMALEKSCGKSYGYEYIIGLHDSFYYAIGVANSDYLVWNYHDNAPSTLYASYFYIASDIYGDDVLRAYRNNMIINNDMPMDITDVLFFDEDYTNTDFDIDLDMNLEGVFTATFRSSWDSDAVYTGLHAGPSHENNSHGDFDTGNFVLSMGGIDWCRDPGTEDYNVGDFFGYNKYKYYRKSAEGHSTVVLRDSEYTYGQNTTGNSGDHPVIDVFYSDENGGYAVTDMTVQYGSGCISGYRGVLLTNSRKTVILQDEISFSDPTSLTWILNMDGDISIAADGRSFTSTFYGDKKTVLRGTLLSDDESLSFRKASKYETVLSATVTRENSGNPLAENPEQRLFIEADGVTDFNVAVVFEIIESTKQVVGYEKVPIDTWTTSDSEWLDDANSEFLNKSYLYNASHFAKAIDDYKKAETFADKDAVLRQTVKYLTSYDPESAQTRSKAEDYKKILKVHNYDLNKINGKFEELLFEKED